jgi:hypothetical protein
MLQKTTDEALRVEDDLAEAIDLIWISMPPFAASSSTPILPMGVPPLAWPAPSSWWSKSSRGVGEQLEVKGPRASQSDIADSDSAQTFTATLDFELEFVAGFGGPDTAALAFAVMQKHGSAVIREEETVFTAPNFADAADLFRHYAASATSETMQKIRAPRGSYRLCEVSNFSTNCARRWNVPHRKVRPALWSTD